ncbi:MAG: hypothetical protein ACOY4R_28235 [Pseudomonadota bacterium]
MGLDWKIDSKASLVTIVADGSVTRQDVERCLDAVKGANASGYRKLLDCRNLIMAIDEHEVLALGGLIRERHAARMGPMAVVLPREPSERLGRLLGIFAMADRPMRLFESPLTARRWLDKVSADSDR